MTAIVTSNFRVVNAQNFKEDVSDVDNSVYVCIGKSDHWSDDIDDLTDGPYPTPEDSTRDIVLAYKGLIAGKRLNASDVTHVVPRYDWTSGNSYVAWDDRDPDIFNKQFYVLTDERKVFKCVRAGSGASIVKPILTQVPPDATGGDGYVWKYMYTLSISDGLKFLTNFYFPIKTVIWEGEDEPTLDDLSESDLVQYTNQQSAAATLNGKIYDVKITNGGTGYTTATVNISGDGTGCTATATIVGGVITRINIANNGQDYSTAVVTINGDGVGATAYAIMSPLNGHGTDPVSELGAYYIAVNARLEYSENTNDFIVDNDFRQIALIKNPLVPGGGSVLNAITFNALRTLQLSDGSEFDPKKGDYIEGSISGARAFIDEFDDVNMTIKYHQNDKTGYGEFIAGEDIVGGLSGSGSLATPTHIDPEYELSSGQMIFLENRDPINRSASQIEDVKIIIEF